MDEQRHSGLAGETASRADDSGEGIRIIGAAEAAKGGKVTPSRPSSVPAPSSVGGSGPDPLDDEWDDAWLAADGDLDDGDLAGGDSTSIMQIATPAASDESTDPASIWDETPAVSPKRSGIPASPIPTQDDRSKVLSESSVSAAKVDNVERIKANFDDDGGMRGEASKSGEIRRRQMPDDELDFTDQDQFDDDLSDEELALNGDFGDDMDDDWDDDESSARSVWAEPKAAEAAAAREPRTIRIANTDAEAPSKQRGSKVAEIDDSRVPNGRSRSRGGSADHSGAAASVRRRSGNGTPEPAVVSSGNRIVTGALLVVLAALIFKFGGRVGILALAVVAAVLALLELFTALRQRGFVPAIIPGLVGAVASPIAAYHRGATGLVVVFILMFFVTSLWYLVGPVRDRPVVNIAVSMLGLTYVSFVVSLIGLLLRPGGAPNTKHGVGIILAAIVGSVAHDVAALLAGKNFGHVPIAPEVSPNKTFEGLIGGVVFAIVVTVIFAKLVTPFKGDFSAMIVLALLVAILAPLGDLVESMMKRDLGIKDMGSLLPGHGGVLDRIDAMLFVLPGVYLLALAKGWV